MFVFKCKMCGGAIEFESGATIGVCDSCGTTQTLPRLDGDFRSNLYDRANHFRRNNEFDKAAGIYERILSEDNTDAEAYWSLVLCRYGIEYVEDPRTHKRVPTVNRTQFTSIFGDDNFKSALRYADGYQRKIYNEEANAINEIQKGILAISRKEEPFDVFICYKETDKNGRRTPDSVLANDLYHQLMREGFKVFFSRITLEDKLGTAYEPYIFAALNSAKVMVVLGTKPENFNAVWVRNEWSRYLALVKQSGGKKVLIPAYRDMEIYDLPDEFSHLQAQDMSKLGFMQDLIHGIKKITQSGGPNRAAGESDRSNIIGAGPKSLLERAFLFLEDGNWDDADAYCEKVLDQDPKNAWAYLGKLMAELHLRRQEDFTDYKDPFGSNNNYQKIVRFGGEETKYVIDINKRNEMAFYRQAVDVVKEAKTEAAYKHAAEIFKTISGFKNADSLAEQCLDRAEICRKTAAYDSAKSQMDRDVKHGYARAIGIFKTISGWRDADEQISVCRQKIKEIMAKEKAKEKAKEIKNCSCFCVVFLLLMLTLCIIVYYSVYNDDLWW
ncbi:MAG: TIR domain-containing protein [Thermoguttaceae bacterium]|jgi:tetratricopeptide (TPR) repeat protein